MLCYGAMLWGSMEYQSYRTWRHGSSSKSQTYTTQSIPYDSISQVKLTLDVYRLLLVRQ